jgi:hypothetical protein
MKNKSIHRSLEPSDFKLESLPPQDRSLPRPRMFNGRRRRLDLEELARLDMAQQIGGLAPQKIRVNRLVLAGRAYLRPGWQCSICGAIHYFRELASACHQSTGGHANRIYFCPKCHRRAGDCICSFNNHTTPLTNE